MADWSKLPTDVLRSILEKTIRFSRDLHRVSSVCSEWRSIALETRCPQLLLLPFDSSKSSCNFYNIGRRHTVGIHLPGIGNRACCSTSHGWLITLSDELDILLLNPYTEVQISLPSHPAYGEIYPRYRPKAHPMGIRFLYAHKIVLSANPAASSNNCVAAGIFGGKQDLAFCKLGDRNWTLLAHRHGFHDVIFYKNKIYAMYWAATILICEVSQDPKLIEIDGPKFFDASGHRAYPRTCYLVESMEGDLLCVMRFLKCPSSRREHGRSFSRKRQYWTHKFRVFKLDQNVDLSKWDDVSGYKNWSRVDCLGDQVLFVGPNHSFALSSDGHPHFEGNCIYFTDDYAEGYTTPPYGRGCHDAGVFNLQDGSVKPFYPDAPYWQTPPIWFHGG